MKEYKVTITETNICEVNVEAESEEEALAMVETDYFANPNDYFLEIDDTTFDVEEE
ncbi:DpnD/PcfM family protein [Eubacterium oxidoreducens]|uniref:DpnD/PcfM-like protein n=1 Tax=Eubacterium oxidoreducens TaxID=1732 RepID=A0A1G6B2T2_EUBOX|nr:DpnD/PcfM family protein [Eubacterium oxidoreducens]SDB14967.1 DpnD/PcfM-like protein [Eubacterium oxidoreducens]